MALAASRVITTESQGGGLLEKPYEPTGNFEKDFKEYSIRNKSIQVPVFGSHVPSDGKPKMRLLMDSPAAESFNVLHISQFAIDPLMARSLASALASSSLTTLKLWNVALTNEVFQCLLKGIQQSCIKYLALDCNSPTRGCEALSEDSYAELLVVPDDMLTDDFEEEVDGTAPRPKFNALQTLSLRCNCISDAGVARIADVLVTNRYLSCLNLYGNAITSRGAVALAKALRQNRTLQALSLAHNAITDVGVAALAEVLSEFELTHEEVVARRKLLSVSMATEDASEDTKTMMRASSTHAVTPRKKDTQPLPKEKEPKSDKKPRQPSAGKTKGGVKDTKASKDKVALKTTKSGREEPVPLLEAARCENHSWFIVGNRALVSLNVSGNPITAASAEALLRCARFQINLGDAGLVRVCLQSAGIAKDCKEIDELDAIMSSRAPNPAPAGSEPQ